MMPAIGTSLFLIAVGAILSYAVTLSVTGVSLPTVGVILVIVGVIGLVISISFTALHLGDRAPGSRVRAVKDPRRR
jgi:hypothetical protein